MTQALTPSQVAALLQATRASVDAELGALPDDVVAWHPAPGEWCAKECLGHILEAERRGFNGRVRTILAESRPDLLGWDQEAVERERKDCDRNLGDLLAEFHAVRDDSIGLVRALRAEDLERGTHEKVGYVTVENLIHEWLHHDRNHFRQVQANVQAYVWSAMGNCQRFAGE
ncbi:MAG: DinB family protein [Chloroflexi bacterium]|nr:DinB family protein [Chloroflexota bacterium]